MGCGDRAPRPDESLDTGVGDADAGTVRSAVRADAGPTSCDPIDNSGCPDEQDCVWVPHQNDLQCTEVSSRAAVGEPCQAACEMGSACVRLPKTSVGRCLEICRPSAKGEDCSLGGSESVCATLDGTDPAYGVCLPYVSCDPLMDACPRDSVCSLLQGGVLGCARSGSGTAYTACSGQRPCGRGLLCLNVAGGEGERCYEPCDASAMASGCTTENSRCRPIHGRHFGVCTPSVPCAPIYDNCPMGQKCTLTGVGSTECAPAGTVPAGGDCSLLRCQRGLLCVRVSSTVPPTCRQPCGATHPCANGMTCVDRIRGYSFGICRAAADG